MEVFCDYAYYYNAFYKDKNYKAEAYQVDYLLRKYGKNVKRIINYGCGTGRHDVALSDMNYECNGIDISPSMIEIAQKNADEAKRNLLFSVADIRTYEPKEKYDAVISLFHVMSYQNTNNEVLSVLQSARRALNKDGIFLFDTWYGPGVLSNKPELRVKQVQDDRYRLIRIATPKMHNETSVVDVCYEVFVIDNMTGETRTINEIHKMRYFFRPELENYLNNSGFALIDNLDCLTLEATTYDSWTSYFVARAV